MIQELNNIELIKKGNDHVSSHFDKDVVGSQIIAELCHRLSAFTESTLPIQLNNDEIKKRQG